MTRPISQIEAVRAAMEASGGYATLAQLYRGALHIEGADWSGTKTPFASMRRIVQTSPLFWRIRPGLWALKSEEARLRAALELPFEAPPAATERFDHGYYQGLLLEIGNSENFGTFVPAQDKNRRFIEKPLHELATLSAPPAFTFERLMRHAKTIDVAWYNRREFPDSFFEVEHSTDIQNSLLKFLEFQDLRTRFFIVADEARKREWADKMNRAAFEPLHGRVEFLGYEAVSKRHSNAAERAALNQST
jgi:hypothetical protein